MRTQTKVYLANSYGFFLTGTKLFHWKECNNVTSLTVRTLKPGMWIHTIYSKSVMIQEYKNDL